MNQLKSICLLALVLSGYLVILVAYAPSVLALTPEQKKVIDSGIYYYNVEKDVPRTACKSGGTTTLIGNDNAEKIWHFLRDKGLSSEQAAGVMGNLQAESGFIPKRVQGTQTPDGDKDNVTVDGVTGYGLAQWTTAGRQQGLADLAASRGVISGDLTVQLDYLFQEASSRGDWDALKTATSVEDATLNWHRNFERSDDGPEKLQNRIGFANDAFNQFGSSAGGGASTTTSPSPAASNCAGGAAGGGVVAGSIVQTALGLAWPDYGHGPGCELATPAFQAAVQQFSSGDPTSCTGCDVFVATVMRASGVDPNYPLTLTDVQLDYVKAHPEKYQILGTTTSSTVDPQLQPGDILINPNKSDGHTVIYTGDQPGGNIVDASNGGRVPQANHWGGGGYPSTYTIVRVIS